MRAGAATGGMRLGKLDLEWPVVMGILNVTPDSFSDGGRFQSRDAALRHAEQMVAAGAAIIDVGGESTRPGAATVSAAEELDRILPVVEALRASADVAVSVDTSKPEVMRAAVAAGADLINDVRALREDGALQAVAETGAAVCLMHMQGEPGTMQVAPEYKDVTAEVTQFLVSRLSQCVNAGIRRDRILLDPGFGFGKTHAHNMRLLADLGRLTRLGQPLLVGLSRKASLGLLTGKPADERAAASAAAAVIAVLQGAAIVRVHDVPETIDALRVVSAFIETQSN
jgi:dihydropteroate synthase